MAALQLDRYRHVIWDWNGTLLDDADIARGVVDAMLRRRDLPGMSSMDRYHEVFDFPIQAYYERIGFDFASEPYDELAVEFHQGYGAALPDMRLHAGAVAALERVLDHGLDQSVLSATNQPRLERQVARFGIAHFFRALVGIDDDHAGSKIGHGRRWIAELEEPRASFVLIGDTVHDHQVAEALGVDCLLVADGHQPRRRLEACGVPVLNSLAELFAD